MRSGLVALLLAAALPAAAARIEFSVKKDGVRLPGSEICIFPAASISNPLEAYFYSNDLTCLDADKVIEVPGGRWNFFARRGTEYTSFHLGLMSLSADNRSYKRLVVPVERAAVADFSKVLAEVREPAYAGAWIYSAAVQGRFAPLKPGESTLLVPAGSAFLPMIVSGGSVIRIGAPREARAGAVIEAELGDPKQTGDLIAWVRTDRSFAEGGRYDSDPPLAVAITSDGSRRVPIQPDRFERMDLQIFRNIPVGRVRVTVSGATWETDEALTTIDHPGAVATVSPLFVGLAAKLSVVVPKGLRTHVQLLRCATPSNCSVADEQWSETGLVVFEGIGRGAYVVRRGECRTNVFLRAGECAELRGPACD